MGEIGRCSRGFGVISVARLLRDSRHHNGGEAGIIVSIGIHVTKILNDW